MTLEYLNNRDAILDILEADRIAQLGMAMQWAHDTSAPELTDLWTALFDNAQRSGNCNGHACDVSRTTLILLNAWVESKKRRAA